MSGTVPLENREELHRRIAELEHRVALIEQRNRRVEGNKVWETSRTRMLAISSLTYAVMTLIFMALSSNRPMFDAVVPTLGFVISTLSLSMIRGWWERQRSDGR